MKFVLNLHIIIVTLASLSFISAQQPANLSCYQCIRKVHVECEPHELQPCPPVSDRCVTHISKNAESGFTIKRECGLGPCGFDDDMAKKGLGLDHCDRSRHEYFCIFCCRESGCNKSISAHHTSSLFLLSCTLSLIFWKNKILG